MGCNAGDGILKASRGIQCVFHRGNINVKCGVYYNLMSLLRSICFDCIVSAQSGIRLLPSEHRTSWLKVMQIRWTVVTNI